MTVPALFCISALTWLVAHLLAGSAARRTRLSPLVSVTWILARGATIGLGVILVVRWMIRA